jgi:histidinol-phosphatase (PHP family)
MADMAASALTLGLTGLTFTEHVEWYEDDEAYGYLDPDAYFTELDATRARYSDDLIVLSGVELGNPHDFPEEASALLDHTPFDLVIGSIHWLDGLPGWLPPVFDQGMEATYRQYFDEVVAMVDQAEFDVLGHLDLVRRDSWELFGRALELDAYRDMIDTALQRLIDSGRGLEINTSGWRKGLSEPLPGLEILRRYRDLGGEVLVFSSDGHNSNDIGYGFGRAHELARAAGFDRYARFEERCVRDWINL